LITFVTIPDTKHVSDKDSLIIIVNGLEMHIRVLDGEYEEVYKFLKEHFNFILSHKRTTIITEY